MTTEDESSAAFSEAVDSARHLAKPIITELGDDLAAWSGAATFGQAFQDIMLGVMEEASACKSRDEEFSLLLLGYAAMVGINQELRETYHRLRAAE